jgi:ACS family sodium-dependent inorganic phosphate cotransporter
LERSHLASFAGSGSYVGTVISLPLAGLLANNFGWPSVFYVFGKTVSTCPSGQFHLI